MRMLPLILATQVEQCHWSLMILESVLISNVGLLTFVACYATGVGEGFPVSGSVDVRHPWLARLVVLRLLAGRAWPLTIDVSLTWSQDIMIELNVCALFLHVWSQLVA